MHALKRCGKNAHHLPVLPKTVLVGTYQELIPTTADLVVNLTSEPNNTLVVANVMPLMKQGAAFSYSHGF